MALSKIKTKEEKALELENAKPSEEVIENDNVILEEKPKKLKSKNKV